MRIIRTAQFVSGRRISSEEYDKYSKETTHFHITLSDNSFMSFGVHDSAAESYAQQMSQFLNELEGSGFEGAAGTEVEFVQHMKGLDGGSSSQTMYHGFIQKNEDTFEQIHRKSWVLGRELNPPEYQYVSEEIERFEDEKEQRKARYMDWDQDPEPEVDPAYLDPEHAQKSSPGTGGGIGSHPSLGTGLSI